MTTVLDTATVSPAPSARRPRSAGRLWVLPPLLLVLLVVLYPLLRVFGESTGSWTAVLGSAAFRDALWRTVAIAATSTLGCLVLGTFLAIVLAFVPFPGSPWSAG